MVSMLENDLTSDILIYNLLRKSDDEFINEFMHSSDYSFCIYEKSSGY